MWSEVIVDGALRLDLPTVRKRTDQVLLGHNQALRA
jgi:hypothetical protein